MSDTPTFQGLSLMGGSAIRVTGDRATNTVTSVEQLPVAATETGFSGDVERPSMQPAMTADAATEEHVKLADALAKVDAKLAAQRFDTKTGKPTGYQAEGRDRELLNLEKQRFENALAYLGVRAQEQLPKRGAAQDAADQTLIDGAQRERNIAALAETRDSTGKEIGRIAAARLIDEATARAKAEALVRGR